MDNDHLIVVAKLPLGPTILSISWCLLGLLWHPAAGIAGIGFAVYSITVVPDKLYLLKIGRHGNDGH
jgi:hypothetical protein